MSEYNQALAAMIQIAGGIVPERPFIEIHNSADRALRAWIKEIASQPEPTAERRGRNRAKGPGFKRLNPAEHFPAIKGV